MQSTAFELNYENKEVPKKFAYHQDTLRRTTDWKALIQRYPLVLRFTHTQNRKIQYTNRLHFPTGKFDNSYLQVLRPLIHWNQLQPPNDTMIKYFHWIWTLHGLEVLERKPHITSSAATYKQTIMGKGRGCTTYLSVLSPGNHLTPGVRSGNFEDLLHGKWSSKFKVSFLHKD